MVFRKILEALISLTGLALITFFLLKKLPGGPFDDETPLHPTVRENLEKAWALHGGFWEQLGAYGKSLLDGSFGWSMTEPGRTVGSMIQQGFSQTMILNVISLFVVFILGFALAFAISARTSGWLFQTMNSLVAALVAVPHLFLGSLLIWVFAIKLDWLPVAFLENPFSYILPVLTLSLRPAAAVARILAVSLRESSVADYMRTARAKGLSSRQALVRHALRNSLLPLLGYSSTLIVALLSGSFIVEVLFAVRGLGSMFVEALFHRDQTVVMGLTLFYGTLLISTSALLDLCMFFADPRLRDGDS